MSWLLILNGEVVIISEGEIGIIVLMILFLWVVIINVIFEFFEIFIISILCDIIVGCFIN